MTRTDVVKSDCGQHRKTNHDAGTHEHQPPPLLGGRPGRSGDEESQPGEPRGYHCSAEPNDYRAERGQR